MKPIFVVWISALLIGHTLGYYLPVNEYNPQSCGCGARNPEYDYRADSMPESPAEDVKYKFDFEVQQPKAAENYENEPKSYNYQIQTPPSEVEPDNTKYKFDYTLQAPVDEKPVQKPEQILYTKVDRMTQDKPECSCKQGAPCTCGYSPEQCAANCQGRSDPSNPGYVLPVQYDNQGDFVVYEFPEQQQYSNRRTRQVLAPVSADSPLAPISERIQAFINSDSMRAAADAVRQQTEAFRGRLSQLTNGGEERVGSALDVSSIKSKFSSAMDKFGTHFGSAADLVKGITQSFSRKKRDVSDDERRSDDKRMPMLRVEEYKGPARVEQRADEQQQKEAEKATQCHRCGTKLSDVMCTRCGEYQPQYVEYIEGKPVSFYPGATPENQSDESSKAPRYIYDRYGHKYVENNGNLRLIAPQYQEAVVGDQPNFAGLADILNENQEVMRAINVHPGRVLPEPVDLAQDVIEIVRSLARRDVDNKKNERQVSMSDDKQAARQEPRSMYQVVPMKYDGKDGKLVVKVYSSKNDKTKPIESSLSPAADDAANMMEKSKPTIRKFTKNHRDYEIISFDDYKGNSDEDIRQVLDHIYGKKSW